ncbi:hypothetical protein C8R43DRAFT_1009341 [Mycena crocata]|nr:hypothetical protein C8R43DRAFT_1009341 [Mycena crocata]
MANVHPAFNLKQLSRLPRESRIAARDAVNGKPEALKRMENLMRAAKDAPARLLFLPVFYAILDPENIPTLDELDTLPSVSSLPHAFSAIILLEAAMAEVPSRLLCLLWPRVWAFMKVLDLYCHFLPAPACDPKVIQRAFVKFIGGMYGFDKALGRLIDATRGVRVLLAHSWASLFVNESFQLIPTSRFINDSSLRPEDIQEFTEGAGGRRAFCTLLVRHFDYIAGLPGPSARTNDICVQGAIQFIERLRDADADLFQILLSCEFPGALTNLIRVIQKEDLQYSISEPIEHGFSLLLSAGSYRMCHPWIEDAVQTDLLWAVLNIRDVDVQAANLASRLLDNVLTPCLVYHSFIGSMKDALERTVSAGFTPASVIAESWNRFVGVARDRIAVYERYNAGDCTSFQACDNVKCAQILPRKEFQRCGGCSRRYYCSPACQRADWRSDHHEVCAELSWREPSPTRDRAFLRALLSQSDKREMFMHQVAFMRDNPDTPFYTLHNYLLAPPEITVIALRDLLAFSLNDPLWVDCVRRAEKSGGRMELHLVDFFEGPTNTTRVAPKRFRSPEVHHELLAIAAGIARGGDTDTVAVAERIEALCAQAEDGVYCGPDALLFGRTFTS